MGEMDDTGLLGLARRGDETAFSLLFARHQRQLFRYASYMGGADAADDIVQDTFLAVLRQKGRTDTLTGSVIGYLIGIARHLIMKQREQPWPLCELEDLDYADAAAMMQCPVGTVRSRLHRARALLAAKLSGRDQ